MMTGSGKPGHIELSVDGKPVGVISDRSFDFALDGVGYTVKRTGLVAVTYRLLRDQEVVATAEQVPLLNRYRIDHAGRQWMLRAEGLRAKRYNLFQGDEKVGRITPTDWRLYRNIEIELPDALSRPAQIFLVWLAAWSWSSGGD